jgi:hypothetical protein
MFNSLPYKESATHATQIAAYQDEASVKLVHDGAKISEIPFFAPGTGTACGPKGYDALTIDTSHNHHHYIFYEDPDNRRAKLEKWKGDTARLSWKIPKIGSQGHEKTIANTDIKSFYLILLNDFDMNGIIEDGEYAVVKVVFK